MIIVNTSKTLKSFFERIAPSFIHDSVPYGIKTPYCTYSVSSVAMGEEGMIQLRIFSESTSVEEVLTLANKVDEAITMNGTVIKNGDSFLWLRQGSPFIQLEPSGEEGLKIAYINIIYRNV